MHILTSTSLKSKMTLTVLLLVSMIMLLVAGTIYRFWHDDLKNSISTQQDALVIALARQLDDKLLLAQEQLTHFSRRVDRSVMENPHLFQAIMDDEDDVSVLFGGGLVLVSKEGKVIAEYPLASEKLPGSNRSDREYFKQTIATGKPVISSPYVSASLKKPTIAFTVPIFGENRTLTAILVGRHDLEPSRIFSSLRDFKIGTSGYLYIIDKDRDMVLHPDPKRIGEVLPAGLNAGLDRALNGFEGTIENVNSKGIKGLTSFKQLKSTNWVLAAHNPLKGAYAPLYRAKVYVIFILAVGLLLTIVISHYFVGRLTAPLHELTRHVREFPSKCDKERVFPVTSTDEIGHLGEAFNGLVKQLEDEKFFFGSLIQNAAAPMFVLDQNHNIIFWNDALAGLTGYSSCQMIGTNRQWSPFYNTVRPVLADLVIDHSLDRVDEFYSHHSSSLFQADSLQAEGWYENLGGKRRYIFFEAAPIINSNNEIIAAVETLEDITDRKLAQEESATHSLFLREIMNAIPNPVYYKNIEGVYLGCNAAFKQFFNKTEEEIIGRKLQDIMHEDYIGQSMQKDQDIINFCRSVQYETDLIRDDGEKRSVLVSKAPFSHSDGSLAGIVGAFVDITDQLRMDDQVRKMSRALEQSPATIVITNLDGVIEYVNPKFCQTTGYTAEEAIGQHTRVLKSGTMSAEGYAELWKTISSGKEWRGEFHNVRKDGSLYWENATISPLFDKDGGITGYLAVKEDITGRKEIEASLYRYRQELENKHAELKQVFSQVEQAKYEWENTLDHLRDFVILTDNRHHVRRYNRLLAEMSGKTDEELVGEDWRRLLTDAGFTFVAFEGTSGEVFHERSGRSYDLNIFEIQEDGAHTGFVVSINDTTELRLAGQELQKAYAELKEAQLQIFQQEKATSIDKLAAGVAHEINNPMGFISSNLGTLNKYVDRLSEYISAGEKAVATCGDSVEASHLHELRRRLKIEYIMDDARQLIEESQDGAERVRRIVQDLKSFSRVDQSVKGLINLNETLETTINIAWNEIKYVAALNREFGDIPEILCFPQQLNQVFLNLLVNAAHAMGENQGTIAVRTWSENECVFVSVSDTGCGIPDEIRQRIFEPFFTTKEVGKGTGLGLSISYDIIRKHGGEISVESEVGQGTTFIVRLPVEGPNDQEEQHI